MLAWDYRIEDEVEKEKFNNKNIIEVFHYPDNISFRTIEGYLNFYITNINYILKYGDRNKDANKYLRKIRNILSKFYGNTFYSMTTSDFDEYKLRVSNILNLPINREVINSNNGYFDKWNSELANHLVVLRTKDIRGKEVYDNADVSNFKEYVDNVITEQMNSIRLDKDTTQYLVSKYECHIEIVIAINYLVEAMDYLFRCIGSKAQSLYYSDIMEVESRLNVVPLIINRIKNIK